MDWNFHHSFLFFLFSIANVSHGTFALIQNLFSVSCLQRPKIYGFDPFPEFCGILKPLDGRFGFSRRCLCLIEFLPFLDWSCSRHPLNFPVSMSLSSKLHIQEISLSCWVSVLTSKKFLSLDVSWSWHPQIKVTIWCFEKKKTSNFGCAAKTSLSLSMSFRRWTIQNLFKLKKLYYHTVLLIRVSFVLMCWVRKGLFSKKIWLSLSG